MNDLFLDANFAVALSAKDDQYHDKAEQLAGQVLAGRRLVTTHAVLLEIGNSLSRMRYRQSAVRLLSDLVSDPMVDIVPLTSELYSAAFQLFQERRDKEWGLTDCISFVVMKDFGLDEALTSDVHFEQAGFRALLRET